MSEQLTTTPLAQSREAKRNTTDRGQREKVVAEQVARISKKLIDRANQSGLGTGAYGGSEGSYTTRKPSPSGEGHLITTVEARKGHGDELGSARITQGVTNQIGELGTEVSAVPEVGVSARNYARAGGKEVNSRLEGDRENEATNKVPAQLAELRGNLATDEVNQQKRKEEFDAWINSDRPFPGTTEPSSK